MVNVSLCACAPFLLKIAKNYQATVELKTPRSVLQKVVFECSGLSVSVQSIST